jgi:FkbM family methyltransferase
MFWGASVEGIHIDGVFRAAHRYGYFEEDTSRALISVLREGMSVIDVGAHIGCHTLLAAHLVGSGGHVVALEPTPRTFEILRRNALPYRQVEVVQAAAGERAGVSQLSDYGGRLGAFNTLASVRLTGRVPNPRALDVPVVTIDELVRERNLHPALIKIDAENSEMSVLRGAVGVLDEDRPAVVAEVGDIGQPSGSTLEVVQFMGAHRYKAFEWAGGRFAPYDAAPPHEYRNLLFKPCP